MAAVAKNPAFAKKVGIKQSVGKEFAAADKVKNLTEAVWLKKIQRWTWLKTKR